MNFNILTLATMITITKFWLLDAAARAIIGSHELGRAYRGQLQLVYQLLLALDARQSDADAQLRKLGEALTALDYRHDNKARAAYYHVLGLRAGTEDPALIAECDDLLRRFFPKKLAVVTWSYLDEGGWAEAMNEKMTPALRARLATIQVGEFTLAEIFDAWLEAGMALGQDTVVRDRLEATVSASGASDAAISRRAVRSRWIRVAQTFIHNLGLMGLTDEQLEVVLSPINKAIAAAELRQARGEPVGDDELPGDELPEPVPEAEINAEQPEPVGDAASDADTSAS